MARLCGLSQSNFAARFRLVVGTGQLSYLLRWRMALAKKASKSSTMKVEKIALSIGYKASSLFSTAFTRAFGCPPSRFAN